MQRFIIRHYKLTFLSLMVVRILICSWYVSYLPAFEMFDEAYHYQVIRATIHENRIVNASDAPPVSEALTIYQQFNQPPLYYFVTSLVVRYFDHSMDYDIQSTGVSNCLTEQIHFYTHPINNHNIRQGIFVARFLTFGSSLIALGLLWWASRLLRPKQPELAVLACSIFAIAPPTVAISIWTNNDALLMVWGAAILVLLARYITHQWGRYDNLYLALLCIFSILTKLNGIALLPMLIIFIKRKTIIAFAGSIVAGMIGFFIINIVQCGNMFCRLHRYNLHFDDVDSFLSTLRLDYFRDGFAQLIPDFLVALPRSDLVYVPTIILFVIFGIWFIGWIYALSNGIELSIFLGILILVASSIGIAGLRVWWLQVGYFAARYIIIALPALCLLWAFGTVSSSRQLLLIPMLILSLGIPYFFSYPLIERPVLVTTIPPTAQFTQLQLDSGTVLYGYEVKNNNLLRIYWETIPTNEALFVVIQIPNGQQCGQFLGTTWQQLEVSENNLIVQDFTFVDLSVANSFSLALFPFRDLPPPITFYDNRMLMDSITLPIANTDN